MRNTCKSDLEGNIAYGHFGCADQVSRLLEAHSNNVFMNALSGILFVDLSIASGSLAGVTNEIMTVISVVIGMLLIDRKNEKSKTYR